MISVLIYGRNDGHGYNLHKRTAIFFNTIALQLTHVDDEIVFVDCNSHDALPTFPEAIHDLLTPAAKRLIRIVRIRPEVFRKALPGSRLPCTEALSRNVALRRSSPRNRYVLSTNSDMVFASLREGETLSRAAEALDGQHAFLPRFDVPEWLWESLNRFDPEGVVQSVKDWSRRFHLNEHCRHKDDLLFDSPGDFQLIARDRLFAIHGFDERMNLGWHIDSNIGRRLYLKYGSPKDLSGSFEGFHLNHNLQHNALHDENLTRNDLHRFYLDLREPEIPEQAETWGLNGVELEEIRLPSPRFATFAKALDVSEPSAPPTPAISYCTLDSYNENLYYDAAHVFPFIANFLAGTPPGYLIGYWGVHVSIAKAMAQCLQSLGEGRTLLVSRELAKLDPQLENLGPAARSVPMTELMEAAHLFVVDFHMGRFEITRNPQGMRAPTNNERNTLYGQAFSQGVMEMARADRARMHQGATPRLFLFAGFQNTLFEDIVTFEFHLTMGAFASHVHHGTVRKVSKFDAVRDALDGKATIEEAKARMEKENAQLAHATGNVGDQAKPNAVTATTVETWTPAPRDRSIGFNIIGYLTSHTGLGVAARNTIRLLRNQGFPVACLDIDAGLGRSGKDESLKGLLHDPQKPLPHRINVFHMNPGEVGLLFRSGHPAVQPAGRMNVAVPFWELSRIPGNWVPVLQGMDLVLAPTRFVQDAIAASVSGTAIRYYPQAVDLPAEIAPNRAKWGLPQQALIFGFSFDFTSVMDRKNPIGVMQAFARAFAGRHDVRLVIKMNHSGALDAYKDVAARFKEMEKQNPQLKVIDASLPYGEVLDLMACWDVFVSLHRAEGLGLGLMECMGMGKAVMATGWSGNMDFMHDANSVLIKHRLIPIDPNSAYIGALNGEKGHVWADADLDEAAFWMKRLADDAALRRRLGERAKIDLHRRNAEALRGDTWEQVAQFHEGWEARRRGASDVHAANAAMPGPRGEKPMRVLFQNRSSATVAPGGDTVVMNRYRDGLQKLGVQVEIDHDPAAPLGPHDLVHLFNLVLPRTIEPLAKRAHEAGKPYFVQAFQEDQSWYMGKSLAQTRLLAAYLQQGQKREMLPRLLELMKMAETVPTDTSVWTADHAQAVLVCSQDEAKTVRALQPNAHPVILPYGADVAPCQVDGERFEKAFGVKDFVLCVGRLEARKNQLALLAALEFDDIPIVFADGGVCYAPDYSNLCRYFKRKAPTIYTGRLDKEMLVSAYRAAKAHVLPSWYELPGLVSLEAALYGCNVAATPRGGLRDYLGDTVDYFEPDNLESIRQATLKAISRPRDGAAALKAQAFTWQKTAEGLLQLYRDTLAGKRNPVGTPPVAAQAALQAAN